LKEAGKGSSNRLAAGRCIFPRANSAFSAYRALREQPVLSLTKVNSLWMNAEMHAGAYDF